MKIKDSFSARLLRSLRHPRDGRVRYRPATERTTDMGSQDQHRPPHAPQSPSGPADPADDELAAPEPCRPPRTPLTPPESACAFCTMPGGVHERSCPLRRRPT